ncbi:MAG TPA: prolipoprotein diacylglyceryl transferase [Vicinamibacterales bacterium]|nr:prolipoprotein diacylglyceryl transferase [Vicinamibacterales bacterium]
MLGPYIHRIDPILFDVGSVHLWWYGLSYALGFLQVFLFLRRARRRLGLTESDVYALSILFAVCVLAGGRAIEVAFDEWPFYRRQPWIIPALWLGGMATHGLLVGAAASIAIFSRVSGRSVLALADELVIPGAFLLAMGRVGNFIDGQIVGSVTDGWWGVKFPDAEGFRHPVVLYDGAKNVLLVPILLWVRRSQPPPGRVAAHFVFWYAFLRLFVDLFRDYPTHRLALGTGQTLNVVMTLAGVALLVRSWAKRRPRVPPPPLLRERPPSIGYRLALAGVLLLALTIPSNWTQDVPERYGKRHAGLEHSALYPALDSSPPTRLSSLPTR